MAKEIRSIHASAARSIPLSQVSIYAAYAAALLPCSCDDEGRMTYHPALIKSQVFPLRSDVTEADCAGYIAELMGINWLEVYEVDGREYLQIRSWHEFQKPNRPLASKLPAPKGYKKRKLQTDYTEQIKEVVEYLNEAAGARFSPTAEATIRHANARFAEGRTVEQFKAVIDCKVAQWKDDKKYSEYLRPQTLFGTKFEGYLQDAERKGRTKDEHHGKLKRLG